MLGGLYGRVPLGVRFGRAYINAKAEIDRFVQKDEGQQGDFILGKLRSTIGFAEVHIPFYRNLYKEHEVCAADINDIGDLKEFPTIKKEDIKNNLDDFYTNRFEKSTPYFTGGSTSTPTKYYLPLYTSRGKEKAFNDYLFSKIGKRPRTKTLLLKGRNLSNGNEGYTEWEPVDNYLVASSNHLNSRNFTEILQRIREYSPEYVLGYPSAVLDLIRNAKKRGITRYELQGVILASEMIYKTEIQQIKEFFDCTVLSHYGHTERATMAYRIDDGEYRFLNTYGLAREEKGQIISTSFDNYTMPFINYETNDFVTGRLEYLEGTDLLVSAEEIEGRIQEYLVTEDSRLISICTMGAGHYESLADAEAIQYRQTVPGRAELNVKGKELNLGNIKEELERFVGGAIKFRIVEVDEIEKTSRGKRIMLKQGLDINEIVRTD